MATLVIDNMAPLMFGALVVFLLIGYPVAFALGAVGLTFGLLGIELGLVKPELFQALSERVFGIVRNDTLLAIPFFTFMGLILERSGLAEDLLDTVGQLFGPLRGGLAYAVVLVGALLAATTGVVAASVISMGLISLPIMLRYGYDRRLATGVVAASGTLAQIIPPSVVLIVLADQLGRSVGDMYRGAIVPGLVLTGLYAAFVLGVTIVRPRSAPALPPEARTLRGLALGRRVALALVPPLVLIFLVLGTIFLGMATPTEGGAMGAIGALTLALAKRRLDWKLLRQAMDKTAKLTSFVVFILIGSTMFSLVFRGVDGDLWVESSADEPAGRATRLPDRHQPARLRSRLLSRLLRARLHHHSAAGAGGGKARDRSDLVRRPAGREHADVVHAPAVRVRPVLLAQRSAARELRRSGDGKDDGGRQHRPDLYGRDPVRVHPDRHGRPGDRFSRTGGP